MKTIKIKSHVLSYDLPEPLGYSQQYYHKSTAHLVEVETDEGITGCGALLEFDTTDNKFRDDLLTEPLNIQRQVAGNDGYWAISGGPGLGIAPDRDFIRHFDIGNT
ncbi:hypothetical protein [Celeribacter sp.]|uniref:hypothetical protein n=1 Tax=Celeribacter sp. TaxID=1890673 RepID=UPI003A92CB69